MSNPPIPPPRHSAKKADHAPDPDSIKYYQKNKDNKYWFEYITDQQWKAKGKAWKNLVTTSIVDYFACMVNTGKISKEGNDEYKKYCDAANKLADSH